MFSWRLWREIDGMLDSLGIGLKSSKLLICRVLFSSDLSGFNLISADSLTHGKVATTKPLRHQPIASASHRDSLVGCVCIDRDWLQFLF